MNPMCDSPKDDLIEEFQGVVLVDKGLNDGF